MELSAEAASELVDDAKATPNDESRYPSCAEEKRPRLNSVPVPAATMG